ncbi:MarR family winged helix-turn-helix transcriptional regulator [Ideonella aquatica]|uniref:MarR family winged helix-turn-helix transcriptional regulator n=1 Tax=Ideonella aquatica TaxID=2824119 RepID=UPI002873F34C|nr:MarR family winged helix-turn-helix transcriptional regulator [Ideonella aquatica]
MSTEAQAAARVLRRFRAVFNAVKRHFQQVEREAGIGGAQLWALSVVQAQPGLGVGELARAMDIHQTTASNLVKSLSALSLLEARRAASDKRALQLHLLPAGQAVLARAPGPFSGVLPDALAGLDADTLARLDHDLGLLLTRLAPARNAGAIPLADLVSAAGASAAPRPDRRTKAG